MKLLFPPVVGIPLFRVDKRPVDNIPRSVAKLLIRKIFRLFIGTKELRILHTQQKAKGFLNVQSFYSAKKQKTLFS